MWSPSTSSTGSSTTSATAGIQLARRCVGTKIGADKIGASLYELAPGERTFPYHYEYPREEWLIVVAGSRRCAFRTESTRCGPATSSASGKARRERTVRNDTDEPVRVLIASTKSDPAAPSIRDSGKIGIWPGTMPIRRSG